MLDLKDPRLHITLLSEPFHLIQLPASLFGQLGPLIQHAAELSFFSLTRTADEVSIVTAGPAPTGDLSPLSSRLAYEGPWGCLRVRGPMDLELSGVMHAMTKPLAGAEVAVFAVSTWNTDFVLVHEVDREKAVTALREDGWSVDVEGQ